MTPQPEAVTVAYQEAVDVAYQTARRCRENTDDSDLTIGTAVLEAVAPLIAAAERGRILGVVRRVHRMSDLGGEHCVNCRFAWPCPTEQVLADLG